MYEMAGHKPAFKAFVSILLFVYNDVLLNFQSNSIPFYMCISSYELVSEVSAPNRLTILFPFTCASYLMNLSILPKQDVQSLINKINKSIMAPLPTMYSGPL